MNDYEIGDLYDELHEYLFIIIQNRLYDGCPHDDIYDCLNEVFIIALRKKQDPKFRANPKNWLVATTKNVVDNFNRKNVNRLRFHQPNVEVDELPDSEDILEDLALKIALEDDILYKIKQELSLEERVLFTMRFEEGKTTKEIAKELGMRHGTISTRVNRLKKHFELLVTKYVGEEQ